MQHLDYASKALAYQRLQLLDIQKLYNELNLDLDVYLASEQHIADEILFLEREFAEIKKSLTTSGIDLEEIESASSIGDDGDLASSTPTKKYERLEVFSPDSFEDLVKQAENYLLKRGIDTYQDPLLQVLDSREVATITQSYKEKYGDISWDQADYVVVILAGFVATLMDIFLVRTPEGPGKVLGWLPEASPLTKWIKKNSAQIHEDYLKLLVQVAKTSYDSKDDKFYGQTIGLSSKLHRLMSLGHDPILGFIFGVLDIVRGTGTFIDKHGNLVVVKNLFVPPESDIATAFVKVLLHLLSDVFTSAGIQPPFFTLLQLLKANSPFVIGPSGETVSWTNVARYMYAHGYDLRHFFTMGLVPATVEIIIRGYWLLRNFDDKADLDRIKVKMTSMLLLGHTIALSGNLVKTGLIFQMNPLALNWAEILAFLPVTVSWISESIEREKFIRNKLDEEWLNIYRSSFGY